MREWTHRLEKVRQYRGMRTPIGTKIRKVVDARKAWILIRLSYSGGGTVAIVSAALAGRGGEGLRWWSESERKDRDAREEKKGERN